MSFQKIQHKCIKCGCEEAEVIPTQYGTAAMCVQCMDIIKLNGVISNPNQPKCPTCSSTNVQKIGTGERVASVATFGIFSKKINKSFKCKSCGYTW